MISISILEGSDYLAIVEGGFSEDRYSVPKSSPNQQGICTCSLTHNGLLGYIMNGKCYWLQIDSPSKVRSQQGSAEIIQSSDALSMAHSLSGNTFYGGFRNGRVQLYDIRASRSPMRGFNESSAVCDLLPLYVTNNALDPYSCDSPYIYTSVMNGQVGFL